MNREDTNACIAVAVVTLPFVIYLSYQLLAKVQAHMSEFMLTLIVATLPIAIALRQDPQHPERVAKIAGALVFPGLMLMAGAIWGLSIAKRLHENRPWRRLGLLLLGWCLCPAGASLIFAPLMTISLIYDRFATGRMIFMVVLAWLLALPLIPAYFLEKRVSRTTDNSFQERT